MSRPLAIATALLALCNCSNGTASSARVSAAKDLSIVQASYGIGRYSHSGAPVATLVITGTIANRGHAPLACGVSSFIVTDAGGNSYSPVSASCDVPQIAPSDAAAFSAVFRTPLHRKLELHFEHDDGTYEVRALHPAS